MQLERVAPVPALSDTLRDVMLAIALNQPDKADREAMLAIMRRDGWLPPAVDVREVAESVV